MSRYQDILGRINYGIFLVAFALMPFPQIGLRYAIVLWVISYLLEGRWLRRPLSLRDNPVAIPFILFGLWWAWKALSVCWAPDITAWTQQMERYLTFLFIVPAGIWGLNAHYDWKQAGRVLVISCMCALPIYLSLFTTLFYHREIVDALEWKACWDYSPTTWYGFFAANVSILKHRLYLCSVEFFGAIVAVLLYRKRPWMLMHVLAVIGLLILLSGSRQSVITGAVLAVAGIIYWLPERYRLRYGLIAAALGIAAAGSILFIHPRMNENRQEDRPLIWQAALQQPHDYIAHGVGAGQSTNYLMMRYEQEGLTECIAEHNHSHNQYLEELIEIGIGGLILFLLAWLSIPLCTPKEARWTALLFPLLFMLNMCTDCMFEMFDGVALWAACMLFIATYLSSPSRAA